MCFSKYLSNTDNFSNFLLQRIFYFKSQCVGLSCDQIKKNIFTNVHVTRDVVQILVKCTTAMHGEQRERTQPPSVPRVRCIYVCVRHHHDDDVHRKILVCL